MRSARIMSVVAVLVLTLSAVLSAQTPRVEAQRQPAPQKKLSALAARFEGKLSPMLLDRVATTSERLRVIVLLEEPRLAEASSIDFASSRDLQAYMAEADRMIESVISEIPSTELNVEHRYRTISGFAGEVSLAGMESLAKNPAVRIINPDLPKHTVRVEGKALMNVSAVHARGARGAGVTVAVIDDGVDYSHPELGGTPIGVFPNSVVIGGYDFVVNVADPSPFPIDSNNSHGTSVAGIIAGRGDNRGGSGVAPEAKIVGLRIGNSEGLSTGREIAALDWIVQNRTSVNPAIKVANLSLGGEPYVRGGCDGHPDVVAEKAAIDRVAAAGVAIVVSSGNEAKIGMGAPACLANTISVGAVYDANIGGAAFSNCTDPTSAADQLTCYSNIDEKTTLLAPSHNAYSPQAGGGYDEEFGGTSAASPYTAGAMAVLISKFPGKTVAQYRDTLRSTGRPLTYTQPGLSITTPRVDLNAAYGSLEGTGGTPGGPCVPGGGTLCLQSNRFEVTILGEFNGVTAPGQAVPINNQFGYFSIPGLTNDPSNAEILVKIAGPLPGGKYWVFYGALSGFQVTVTIRDTQTGKVKSYNKAANSLCGGLDFDTF